MQAVTLSGVTGKRLAERFGDVVRRQRKGAELSQEALADRCGLHRTYVGSIERGEKTVTIATAEKLARAFGLRLWQLLKAAEEEPTTRSTTRP